MYTKDLRSKLSTIYRNYVEAYDKISDQDYKAYLQTLTPGAIAPPKYHFFSDEYRETFAGEAQRYRDEALAIIDDALDRIRIKKTTAPTTEAVNYLTMLKDKPDLTEGDIENALTTYGENYSAYNAIRNLADTNNIRGVDASDLDRLENELREYVLPAFSRFGVIDAENGHATEGALAMFDSLTLGNLPEISF